MKFFLAILSVFFCSVTTLAQAGGGTGGGNPPTGIRRGASQVSIDANGNTYFDLMTGKVIRIKNTCTGAAVSASGEASICFNGTALRLSVNGGAYVSLGAGTVTGIGTTNTIIKWTNGASGVIGNSGVTDNGTILTATGYRVIAAEYDSDVANGATNGTIRFAKTDFIAWRNQANSADINLSLDASNRVASSGGFAGALTGNVTGNVTGAASGNELPLTFSSPLSRSVNAVSCPTCVLTTNLGANVATFLATPTGANLASALTTALPPSKGGTGLSALGTALQQLRVNAGGTTLEYFTPTTGLTGSGTPDTLPKFTGASSIGDSRITDDGTNITIDANAGGVSINADGSSSFGDANSNGFAFLDVEPASHNSSFGDSSGTLITVAGIAGTINLAGNITVNKTVTAAGTTGAQTINATSGSVNFAAAATSLAVTNNLVTALSIITCTVATNDTTLKAVQCVAGSGIFTIFASAAATAETRVNFLVIN